jgi:hypothetical protein
MKRPTALLLCLCLAVPVPALASPAAPAPAAPADGFGRLWTGWNSANREALEREAAAAERLQADLADAERRRVLRDQGRALGERVGEIVALGDCAEGERVARAAGDFALVEAVRAHCRAIPTVSSQPPQP